MVRNDWVVGGDRRAAAADRIYAAATDLVVREGLECVRHRHPGSTSPLFAGHHLSLRRRQGADTGRGIDAPISGHHQYCSACGRWIEWLGASRHRHHRGTGTNQVRPPQATNAQFKQSTRTRRVAFIASAASSCSRPHRHHRRRSRSGAMDCARGVVAGLLATGERSASNSRCCGASSLPHSIKSHGPRPGYGSVAELPFG